eukprot:gene8114-8308_t
MALALFTGLCWAASAAAVLQRFAGGPSGSPAAVAATSGAMFSGSHLPSGDPATWQQGQENSNSFSNPAMPAGSIHLGAIATVASGLESGQSSSSTNVQSGMLSEANAFSSQGLASGLFSSLDMVYGVDGLDTPGTAQVAVHNVPFKWCNTDLEALFHRMPGYLDAQLLFHENGRSKGVGVVLFSDTTAAADAASKLSGAQADGRKLEMVLMNPDNHISFSCKQVAVLGLPWEYTAADVRALIEAAAEADGDSAADAGVEAVEVAYRDDGKSEGRAIATFLSRRQAHAAITRLHGKETLAGLRMRLFYLHEQQQRQQLLSQAPGSLLTSMGQLSVDTPSPTAAGAGILAQNANKVDPAAVALGALAAAGDWGAGPYSSLGSVEGDRVLGGGASGRGAAEQAGGETAPAGDGGSARSSFDKDQGPVILHVSGLMESVSREQLRELFSQAGEVTKVDIPDGGRSMGYGFITFSNPQAAEQAMLLFNNYPLGGGAIHVAYSTSATAKARQQALRQARKATLGARGSMDTGPGSSSTAAGSGPLPSVKPTTPRGLAAGAGAPGPTGVPDMPPGGARRAGVSFEDPHSGPLGSIEPLQGLNPVRHSFDHPGYSSGITSPAAAAGILARTRTPSATSGLNLQGPGVNSAGAAALNPAGLGAPGAAGMFPAAAATGGLLGGGAGPSGMLGHAGMGSLRQLQEPGGGMLFPSGIGGGMLAGGSMPNTQLLVTGLPAGLGQEQLAQLFELCGPLRSIHKPRDKEFVLVTFETLEGAIKAVQVLNGTSVPSGGVLSVHFAPVMPEGGPTAPGQPGFGNLGLFDQHVNNSTWGQMTSNSHMQGIADPAAVLGDVLTGNSAAGSGSLWHAPETASGLSASTVGGFDVRLHMGAHNGFPPAASAPWEAGLAAAAIGEPSSPPAGGSSSQGRPPFPGLYSRAVGSNRISGDGAAPGNLYSSASPLRSNSPANAPVPGAASVYASPLYKAGSAGTGEYGSSGSLPTVQLQQPHHALQGSSGVLDVRGAFAVDELPSAAVAAAWGDLATFSPLGGEGGSSVASSQ